MSDKIPYTRPFITEREVELATDAARNGWGERCYDYIYQFEDLFKAHLGVDYAISTSSCTGALHMGLAALGIGRADEVILADTNWIATAAPITYLGASPVFVDILIDTWCLDPSLVEKAITKRTKAIIATHLYGNLCEMNELLEIGERYGIPVVEDSAEAIGSIYYGKRAGSMGKFGVFSFHGTKTITTGEGGMFVTNDQDLYEKVLTLSNHGRARSQKKQFWPDMIGFKYKMSNIQAAIGCAQLERVDFLIQKKRDIFQKYHEKLKILPCISMNPEKLNTINGYWMPTVVFDKETNIATETIIKNFHDRNIDARVFFWPLSSLQMLQSKVFNEYSSCVCTRAMNLPSYIEMKDSEQESVLQVIQELLHVSK